MACFQHGNKICGKVRNLPIMNALNSIGRHPDETYRIACIKARQRQCGVARRRCGCMKLYYSRHVLTDGVRKIFSTEEKFVGSQGINAAKPVELRCRYRDIVGKRDIRCLLVGHAEPMAFLAIEFPEYRRNEWLERGHDSQRKAYVLVFARSFLTRKKLKKGIPVNTEEGCLKTQAMPSLKLKTITDIVKERLNPFVKLTSDDFTSYYVSSEKHIGSHKTVTSGK